MSITAENDFVLAKSTFSQVPGPVLVPSVQVPVQVPVLGMQVQVQAPVPKTCTSVQIKYQYQYPVQQDCLVAVGHNGCVEQLWLQVIQ